MNKLISILVLLVGTVASAEHHFGDAGCGLGSVVMGSDGNQILAATSNAVGMQTFGISTGSSNCKDAGVVNASHQVPMYIEVNRFVLAKEAAKGSGEILYGLAQLMNCNTQKFSQTLKSNYNQIFVDSGMQPAAIEATINQTISNNRTQNCGA